MRKISGYFFSLLMLLLYSAAGFSQTDTNRTVSLRIGFDVSRLSLYYFQPERKALEFSGDMELYKNVYPAIEIGWNNIALKKDSLYNYYSNGLYSRIGVDYNFLKPESINDNEMFIMGIRYGFSLFNNLANSIRIKDNYWGNFNGDISRKSLSAHWVEFVAGFRTELFKNFYLGWTLRGRMLLAKTKDNETGPYWIPGFGKGSAKSAVGFNYSIFYSIPLYKMKHK